MTNDASGSVGVGLDSELGQCCFSFPFQASRLVLESGTWWRLLPDPASRVGQPIKRVTASKFLELPGPTLQKEEKKVGENFLIYSQSQLSRFSQCHLTVPPHPHFSSTTHHHFTTTRPRLYSAHDSHYWRFLVSLPSFGALSHPRRNAVHQAGKPARGGTSNCERSTALDCDDQISPASSNQHPAALASHCFCSTTEPIRASGYQR